jgi:hypothetical protein
VALRLYFDEDSMSRALIRALQARGMDVANAVDAGMVRRTDREQLEHATAEGRVLYSFNVGHFYRLHRQFLEEGNWHAGLILVSQQRYSVGEQMRRILRLSRERSPEEMRNQVVFLSGRY